MTFFPSVTVAGATVDHADGFFLLASAKTWCALQLEAWAEASPVVIPEQADALSELVDLIDLIEGDGPYWQRAVTQTGFTARAVIRREEA